MPRDLALAVRIAERHGLPTAPAQEVRGAGSVNHVVVLGRGDERVVVRFAREQERGDEFVVESWCLRAAAAAGLPVPAALADGVLDGVPYGVQRYVPHLPLEPADPGRLWWTLGDWARRTADVPVGDDAPDALFTRFGRDLPAAWQAHLDYNRAALTAEDPLLGLGVYPAAEQPRLHERLDRLAATPLRTGLGHGDLVPRNVLRAPDGTLVLIDWGTAACGPVPFADLLTLTGHHTDDDIASPDQLAAFAAGFGTTLPALLAPLDDVRAVAVLDRVRWALDRRPDLVAGVAERGRRDLARLAGRP
ncbi:phosphotransferase [Microlunatus capsulatus]|uniref:Aminoglycoside phosphotransferase (APT) family kinase protein n=1 Tax=Microlunatus capsulatus TaxID=99117 RepID=A0ABS4Z577_9ACTN|nr:aminoglycoside phosphotransferase family protein [Microlunatus capsulatus]MBP2416198.1 aminoglycoside phosphotransferase (APT) family kinase protein [Microlunatus capsulatus]